MRNKNTRKPPSFQKTPLIQKPTAKPKTASLNINTQANRVNENKTATRDIQAPIANINMADKPIRAPINEFYRSNNSDGYVIINNGHIMLNIKHVVTNCNAAGNPRKTVVLGGDITDAAQWLKNLPDIEKKQLLSKNYTEICLEVLGEVANQTSLDTLRLLGGELNAFVKNFNIKVFFSKYAEIPNYLEVSSRNFTLVTGLKEYINQFMDSENCNVILYPGHRFEAKHMFLSAPLVGLTFTKWNLKYHVDESGYHGNSKYVAKDLHRLLYREYYTIDAKLEQRRIQNSGSTSSKWNYK